MSDLLLPEDIWDEDETRTIDIYLEGEDKAIDTIYVSGPDFWDETDWCIEVTGEVVAWCSMNGYSYEDEVTWQYYQDLW